MTANFWTYVFIVLIGLAGGLAFFGVAAFLVFLAERIFFGIRNLTRTVPNKHDEEKWVPEEEHEREVEDEAARREEQLAAIDTISQLDLISPEVAPETVPVTVHTVPVVEESADTAADAVETPPVVPVVEESATRKPEKVAQQSAPIRRQRPSRVKAEPEKPSIEEKAATETVVPAAPSLTLNTSEPVAAPAPVPADATAQSTTVVVPEPKPETVDPDKPTGDKPTGRFPRRQRPARGANKPEPADTPAEAPEDAQTPVAPLVDPLAELRARFPRPRP